MLGTTQMSIRWIQPSDLKQVMEVERESFEFPLTHEEFVDWLKMEQCVCLVYEVRGVVAAYLMYLYDHNRYELLNIAVGRGYRFQRIASELLSHLKMGLNQGRHSISTRVRRKNFPAVNFLLKNGFAVVGKKRETVSETEGAEFVLRMRYVAGD